MWVRDEFMPTQPADSLGRRVMILDNWSEFGEGHVIMPSAIHGFDYLDTLREVFTHGGPHEDVRPTSDKCGDLPCCFPRSKVAHDD